LLSGVKIGFLDVNFKEMYIHLSICSFSMTALPVGGFTIIATIATYVALFIKEEKYSHVVEQKEYTIEKMQ